MVAQQQPTTEESDTTKKARALFEQAEGYYKLQQYDKALELYEEAYLLSKKSGLLFNIGQCHKNMKNYEAALRSYKTFLQDVPDTTIRPQVERLIKDTELKLAEQSASLPTSEPATAPTSTPATAPTSMEDDPKTTQTTSTPFSQKAFQKLQPLNQRSAMPFYSGAVLGGLVGVGAGAFFLSARTQAAQLLSQNNIAATDEVSLQVQRARASGSVAVAFLGVAALSASAGMVISSRNKKIEAQLSTNGAALSTTF